MKSIVMGADVDEAVERAAEERTREIEKFLDDRGFRLASYAVAQKFLPKNKSSAPAGLPVAALEALGHTIKEPK